MRRALVACLLLASLALPAAASAQVPLWGLERPKITGVFAVGQTLNCSDGRWQYALTAKSKRWTRDGTTIGTGDTYTVNAADMGKELYCEITVTSAEAGTMSALSDPFATWGQSPTPTCAVSTPSATRLDDRIGDDGPARVGDIAATWVRMDDHCTVTVSTLYTAESPNRSKVSWYTFDLDGDLATGTRAGYDAFVVLTESSATITKFSAAKGDWDYNAATNVPVYSKGSDKVEFSLPVATLGLVSGAAARVQVMSFSNEGNDYAPDTGTYTFSVAFSADPPPQTPPPADPGPLPKSPQPIARPAVLKQPALAGKARVGERLTCNAGTWSGAPKLTYAWKRNGKTIKRQSKKAYTVRKADRGKKLSCAVTGANAGGTKTVTTRALRVRK